MSNSLSTSRSCQKSIISGAPASLLPATGGPSIQGDFEEPTIYTVEFRISNQQNINVPAGNLIQPGLGNGNITPTATLQWSLGGNTIYRKISVFSGASISGVCEHIVASVADETILPVTFQVGINLSLGGKFVIGVNTVALVNVVTTGLAQTINGVALNTDGMTVLLTFQTSFVDNGIYIVHAGAWTRLPNLGVGVHAGGAYTVIVQGSFSGQWWADIDINGTNDVVGTDQLHFSLSTDPTYQQQYSVTIVGGEGTRPATSLPPTYQKYFPSFDGIFRYGCVNIPAGGQIGLAIPQDIGITSLMVNAGPLNAVANEPITASNFLVQLTDYTATHFLMTYFPLDRLFVPLPSQATLMTFFNFSAFDMIVTITWGVDG